MVPASSVALVVALEGSLDRAVSFQSSTHFLFHSCQNSLNHAIMAVTRSFSCEDFQLFTASPHRVKLSDAFDTAEFSIFPVVWNTQLTSRGLIGEDTPLKLHRLLPSRERGCSWLRKSQRSLAFDRVAFLERTAEVGFCRRDTQQFQF